MGKLTLLILLGALGNTAVAQEYLPPSQRFVIYATVCDAKEQCRIERLAVDADNEVHCQLTAGMMRVVAWLQEHPSLHLKSVNRCGPADEHGV
jgi:hypothetical protein